jgi:hypothetical protein
MTIKTICYCYNCKKELHGVSNIFKITIEMCGTLHFCDNACMRSYLEGRWAELDSEKLTGI